MNAERIVVVALLTDLLLLCCLAGLLLARCWIERLSRWSA